MQQLIPEAALTTQTGDPVKPPKVDNNIRTAWNSYIEWLSKKGLKGHPSLDHNGLGFKMIEEYQKEHPGTPLTKDMVVPIQQDFANYRKYALNQIEQGKGSFGEGVNKDNFLAALSQVDGIPGQRTTSYTFPVGYMKDMNTGEVKNKGFMKPGIPVQNQLTSNP
jgi:hypothetical protein